MFVGSVPGGGLGSGYWVLGASRQGLPVWILCCDIRLVRRIENMLPIKSYRDLQVWQEAMELAKLCYQRTSCFPSRETYGLQSQIRRAAVSIASNIAEGHSRRSLGAYVNHLSIALGSQAELETQIELSCRLLYLNEPEATEVLDLAGRVGRRLHDLIGSLEKRSVDLAPRPGAQGRPPSNRELAPSPQSPAPSTFKEVAN